MAVSAAITPARPGEYGRSAGFLAGPGGGAGGYAAAAEADAAAAGAVASATSALGDAPCEDAGSVLLVDIVALLGPVSERLVWFRSGSMTGIQDVWPAHPTAKLPPPVGRIGIKTPGGTGRGRAGPDHQARRSRPRWLPPSTASSTRRMITEPRNATTSAPMKPLVGPECSCSVANQPPNRPPRTPTTVLAMHPLRSEERR